MLQQTSCGNLNPVTLRLTPVLDSVKRGRHALKTPQRLRRKEMIDAESLGP